MLVEICLSKAKRSFQPPVGCFSNPFPGAIIGFTGHITTLQPLGSLDGTMLPAAVLEEGATKTHHRIDARGDLEELYQATDQDHISSGVCGSFVLRSNQGKDM